MTKRADKTRRFRDLRIAQQFDFIGGDNPTFFHRCTKISARKYVAYPRGERTVYEVGSVNAKVYNVDPVTG